jgi:ribosomal protein S18 acetylase RimI-like enzyme
VTGLEVREAQPDEYEPLGELTVAAYATLPGGGEDGYAGHLRNVRRRAATCPILVAVEDDRLLGGVTYVPGPGTPWSEAETDDEAGFRMLAVSADARSRGVGEALVRACVERARDEGRRGIVLLTREDMTAAHRLYERVGFRRDPGRDWEVEPGFTLRCFALGLER